MPNTFATPTNVMRRVAERLVNNAVFGQPANVNRTLDDEFRLRGVKQGDTITVRLPQRFEVTIGAVMNPTPLTDQTVNVTISDQTNVGFEYDSWAATLEVDDYMERYAMPAVDTLVNNIDQTGLLRMYREVAKVVGTPNVVPTSNQTYTDAVTKLLESSVPLPYIAILSPDMHGQLANANLALFNPPAQISAYFRNGQFGAKALGIDRWFMDQNVHNHLVGALGGTPLVNLAQSGASIAADGATASITNYFRRGDVIQFASVNEINPLSHVSTGRLKDFVVTQNVNSDGGGLLTIPISPSIITTGPFATADEQAANNDAITTFGHASSYAALDTHQGLVYNKEAFVLAMADLVLPRGLWVAERIRNAKLGISVRMLKDSDIINDVHPCRLDTAHGWAAVREVLACRVCGG